MAKLTRETLTLFGGTGPTADFAKFGSQAASAPVKTKDIATIQALAAWVNGWQDAVAIGQAPYLEDMNGLLYVFCYELAYGLQEGWAEWDTGTTYFIGSVVKKTGTFEVYGSIVDNNAGNALPARVTDSNWQYLGNFATVDQLQVYRKPNLQYVSADTVDVEANVYNNLTGVTIMFPDGVLRTVNSTTKTRFNITRNAALSGSLQSGLRTSLTRAVNTTYYLYAVVATDDDTTWVTVGDTLQPTPANYATLNSNFGTKKWRPLGAIRNGDNQSATNVILSFIQIGAETMFTHTDAQGVMGYRLATTASGTSVAYSPTLGSGATDLPSVAVKVKYSAVGSAATGFATYYRDTSGTLQVMVVAQPSAGSQTEYDGAAASGAKIVTSVSGALAIGLSGFTDQVLAAGSLALL